MSNPTAGAVHVDSLLTNISIQFVQSSTKFVATRVFPTIPVSKRSDKYATYNLGDFYRDEVERRTEGGEAVVLGYRTGSTSYYAEEWAASHYIDDQVRANADAPFEPDMDAVTFLTQKMMIKKEVEFVTNFMSTDLWTGSSDGGDVEGGTDFTQWSNAASTPIEDITGESFRIEAATGFLPNKLVLGRAVWFDLKNHPDIVDRVKHTSRDAVTTDLVARLLGLDEILVAGAVRNSQVEGLAPAATSVAHIVGDDALLCYTPASPGLRQPAAGYTFAWTGLIPGAGTIAVERWREESRVSDAIRVRSAWAQKVVSPALGCFFNNCSTNV